MLSTADRHVTRQWQLAAVCSMVSDVLSYGFADVLRASRVGTNRV